MSDMYNVDNIYNFDLSSVLKELNLNNMDELTKLNTNTNNIISCKKYTFKEVSYNIIKYNKQVYKNLDNNIKNNYLNFRSVIFKDNKLVVFSPPKAIDYNHFVENNIKEECYCEDFIDGTMINVFYDDVNNCWEIATRSTVGGKNYFYDDYINIYSNLNRNMENGENHENEIKKIKTFRDMFFQACEYNKFDINNLIKGFVYTFVIQHPYNRIVTPIILPVLYLVKIFRINSLDDEGIKYSIDNINMQSFYNNHNVFLNTTSIKYVYRYPIDNFENLENNFGGGNCAYYCVGIMIYNKQGNRSKIRNSNYNDVKMLRGNYPKLQYNYLCLKKEDRINEFLKYYPEHKVSFYKFRNDMYNYTNNLYMNYVKCYIKKECELKKFNFEYKVHMYNIHKLYIESLKNENKYVDKKIVIDYVNNLHPAQQMFVINYSNYKHDNVCMDKLNIK